MNIEDKREYSIVKKSNEMIQKAKYNLSPMEIKTMSYIFTMVKDTDTKDTIYKFSIPDYIKVSGMKNTGEMYNYIKAQLKGLRDKSFWIINGNEKETLVGWLDKVWIEKGNGIIQVRLDEDLQKYVKGLLNKYTTYSLMYVLPMRSKYSIRLYELLKSFSNLGAYDTDIDYFKKIMDCEHYKNFKDVRTWVLERAIEEINEYTDIAIKYDTIKRGRRVERLAFTIRQRTGKELELTKNLTQRTIKKEI